MPRHGYDQRGLFRPQRPVPPVRLEQFGFRQGFRGDLNPRNMPLDSSPRMENMRIERDSIQQDWGLTKIGIDSTNVVLGLAEHRYIIADVEFQRIFRITRNATTGFLILESWDGSVWIITTASTRPIADVLVSMVSTQNKLVIADGVNPIYVWDEPLALPGVLPVSDGWFFQLTSNKTFVPSRLLSQEPVDGKFDTKYKGSVFHTFTWDSDTDPFPLGAVYPTSLDIVIEASDDNMIWDEVDRTTHTHNFAWVDFEVEQEFEFSTTLSPTIRSIIRPGTKYVRASMENLKFLDDLTFPAKLYVTSRRVEFFGQVIEYDAFDDPGGGVSILSVDAPIAHFIFPFEDRLLALGDTGDPQSLAASADGDITKWAGIDTQLTSLLDTVHDPLDPVQALGMLSDNQAGLIRARNIMRVSETGDPLFPIAIQPWVEGIGTESPQSIAQTRDGIMWLAHNLMVYYWDGGSPPVPVGVPIHRELIDKLTSKVDEVTSTFDPIHDDFWLCTPVGTWIFALGKFIDEQRLEWHSRSELCKLVTVVSKF